VGKNADRYLNIGKKSIIYETGGSPQIDEALPGEA
jgi:hypothetical protein